MEFHNFLYDFNTFIEFNSLGGYVSITNTYFKNFNNCGSILRNKLYIYQATGLTRTTYS